MAIEKDVDNLGRVVIPIKFRKKLDLESDSKILVSLDGDTILISPVNKRCALCGDRIEGNRKFRLCSPGISKVKEDG